MNCEWICTNLAPSVASTAWTSGPELKWTTSPVKKDKRVNQSGIEWTSNLPVLNAHVV